mmetsp:Transcript_36068/g.107867  ORF Transcript_36068/g.107867 Transcript_36068/m.107867 type:complete len:555 (-) Transcript_36068:92-1756(-)
MGESRPNSAAAAGVFGMARRRCLIFGMLLCAAIATLRPFLLARILLSGTMTFANIPSTVEYLAATASTADRTDRTDAPSNKNEDPWDDEEIIPSVEAERCRRYGYTYSPNRTVRRRIFWGSTVADDSWLLLHTVAAESRNIYHTAAFVESNTTHLGMPRQLRFEVGSDEWRRLTRDPTLFGPSTKVTVDYYVDDISAKVERHFMHRQYLHRQLVLERWRMNGMRRDDIGILSDTDETFTRDFLRAAQICDGIPQFHPDTNQDCKMPKVVVAGLVFESSAECVVDDFYLWHPEMILGECVDLIGDRNLHRPPKRTVLDKEEGKRWTRSYRDRGHGGPPDMKFDQYFGPNGPGLNTTDGGPMYPLWNAGDFRQVHGGDMIKAWVNDDEKGKRERLHTGYHFHNFFDDAEIMRRKYDTYGEHLPRAMTDPLAVLHDDLSLAVSCVRGYQNPGFRKRKMDGFDGIRGPRPLLFELDGALRREKHENFTKDVLQDERRHGKGLAVCRSRSCNKKRMSEFTLKYAKERGYVSELIVREDWKNWTSTTRTTMMPVGNQQQA